MVTCSSDHNGFSNIQLGKYCTVEAVKVKGIEHHVHVYKKKARGWTNFYLSGSQ